MRIDLIIYIYMYVYIYIHTKHTFCFLRIVAHALADLFVGLFA